MSTVHRTRVSSRNPTLTWLSQLLSLYSSKSITVPSDFKEQVNAVEVMLNNDGSGLINSLLDFGIESACVDMTVETSNPKLTELLNDWLQNINSEMRGKIPVGIDALAKEYFKERWKGSSFIVMRTIWEDRDGMILPTKMWFCNGRDVVITDNAEQRAKTIGGEQYELRIKNDETMPLPAAKNEKLFVQKPFEKWSADYPTPYLIKRGVYYNSKFLEMLNEKGSNLVNKALEYLMLLKKGDVELAKLGKPEFTYDENDLKKIKEDLQRNVDERNSNPGIPSYVTNFDTQIEHLIPEYNKALNSELYTPIERRILAGLGFIEVLEGITSSRKDSVLNPKVFVSEVKAALKDFSSLITDVLDTALEVNKTAHRKYTSVKRIQIRTSPLKNFYGDDLLQFLRSMYDRGLISKRTVVELGIDIDFDAEVERRKDEQEKGLDDKYPVTMFPPIVNNIDEQMGKNTSAALPKLDNNQQTSPDKKVPESKKGPEAKNYKNMAREVDVDTFLYKEDAIKRSKELGATGFHFFEIEDRAYYKPCKTEEIYKSKLIAFEYALLDEQKLKSKKIKVLDKQEKVLDKMNKKDGEDNEAS
jgi:hypothetical protein